MVASKDPQQSKSQKKEFPLRDIARTRSASFTECYANLCQTVQTQWDVQLRFSRTGMAADEKPSLEEQCVVILSYAQAKALANLLAKLIADYEKEFGEIRLPSGPGKCSPLQSSGGVDQCSLLFLFDFRKGCFPSAFG